MLISPAPQDTTSPLRVTAGGGLPQGSAQLPLHLSAPPWRLGEADTHTDLRDIKGRIPSAPPRGSPGWHDPSRARRGHTCAHPPLAQLTGGTGAAAAPTNSQFRGPPTLSEPRRLPRAPEHPWPGLRQPRPAPPARQRPPAAGHSPAPASLSPPARSSADDRSTAAGDPAGG